MGLKTTLSTDEVSWAITIVPPLLAVTHRPPSDTEILRARCWVMGRESCLTLWAARYCEKYAVG